MSINPLKELTQGLSALWQNKVMGKHEINRLKVFAREVRADQGKNPPLFLLPLCQAIATLEYCVAKDGFVQKQVPSVIPSYNCYSSRLRKDNNQTKATAKSIVFSTRQLPIWLVPKTVGACQQLFL